MTTQSGQLNVFSFRNRNTSDIQRVRLFECDELHASLLVLPPGAAVESHTDAGSNELFDVLEGSGQFTVEGRTFRGDPGKCVFVPAGSLHSLHNDSEDLWTLRVTRQECVRPRHFGKIVKRSIRNLV